MYLHCLGADFSQCFTGISLARLEHLDLSSLKQMNDATLCAFLRITPNLQSLELTSNPMLFSSSYLDTATGSRPNSAALTFSRLLHEVSGLTGSLVSLNLSRTSISNGALELLAKLPELKLKRLCLVSCKELGDSGVIALSLIQQGIEHLDISYNNQLTSASVKYICTNLTTLKYLNISKILLHSKDIKYLLPLSTCTKLVFSACLVETLPTEELSKVLEAWSPMLESLDMSYCAGLTNKSLVSIAYSMTNLTELNLSSCFRFDDITMREISKNLTNLTALSVGWCKHLTDMGLLGLHHQDFTHNCIKECRCSRDNKQTNGKTPYFEYTPPVRDIAPKERVPNKDDVKDAMSRQGEHEVFPITRLSKLQSLDLSVCSKLTDASHLRFPSLASVSLTMCSRITDSSLVGFANSNPLLESINLSGCTGITDKAVFALLTSCRRLAHLNISNCPLVTDASIEALMKTRTKLKTLDISMCNLSIEVINKLEGLMPTLHAVHKRYTSNC